MLLKTALKMVEEEYEKAKKQDWIFNPLAYALYKVWKKANEVKTKRGDENVKL
jgi:hypothetical protein